MRRWKISEQFWKFYRKGSFLPKKRKNCSQNLQVLRPGCHTYTVITDCRKFATKLILYGISSFHFTIRINLKSFPWSVRSAHERYLPKFPATSDARYCVLKPIVHHRFLLSFFKDRYFLHKLALLLYRSSKETTTEAITVVKQWADFFIFWTK